MTDGISKVSLQKDLLEATTYELLVQLIDQMDEADTTISSLQKCPYFWEKGKAVNFFRDISNISMGRKAIYINHKIESQSETICKKDWIMKLDDKFKKEVNSKNQEIPNFYKTAEVKSLIRFIRNMVSLFLLV